jgi:phage repressor protein C with HTH and peptisase S24 domain
MVDARNVAHRILEIGGKQSSIADKLDISPQAVSSWKKGKLPSIETLERFSRLYGIGLQWLLTGEGEKYLVGLSAKEAHPEYSLEKGSEYLSIPCVVVAMAGEPYIQPEHLDPQTKDGYCFKKSTLERWDSITTRDEKWITARLDKKAESMMPTLQPGGIVLVNRRASKFIQSPGIIDGKVFLVNFDEGVVAKRLYIDDKILQLASDNKSFRPKHVDLKRFDLTKFLIGQIIWQGGEVK